MVEAERSCPSTNRGAHWAQPSGGMTVERPRISGPVLLRCHAPSGLPVRLCLNAHCWCRGPVPGHWLAVLRLVRRAFMRSCVTRATPAMPTTTPPPTAAMNSAIPRGIVPAMPRNWTSTFVGFWRMKTINRMRSTSATPVANHAALARVTRGARRPGEVPASEAGASAGPSSVPEEEGSGVTSATFLFLMTTGQRGPLRFARPVAQRPRVGSCLAQSGATRVRDAAKGRRSPRMRTTANRLLGTGVSVR